MLLTDEFISSDNSNDHTHVEGNDYSIYLYPVIYISSNTVSDVGYPYNNLMMYIPPIAFLSFYNQHSKSYILNIICD